MEWTLSQRVLHQQNRLYVQIDEIHTDGYHHELLGLRIEHFVVNHFVESLQKLCLFSIGLLYHIGDEFDEDALGGSKLIRPSEFLPQVSLLLFPLLIAVIAIDEVTDVFESGAAAHTLCQVLADLTEPWKVVLHCEHREFLLAHTFAVLV
jgi:hypothetical protein